MLTQNSATATTKITFRQSHNDQRPVLHYKCNVRSDPGGLPRRNNMVVLTVIFIGSGSLAFYEYTQDFWEYF